MIKKISGKRYHEYFFKNKNTAGHPAVLPYSSSDSESVPPSSA